MRSFPTAVRSSSRWRRPFRVSLCNAEGQVSARRGCSSTNVPPQLLGGRSPQLSAILRQIALKLLNDLFCASFFSANQRQSATPSPGAISRATGREVPDRTTRLLRDAILGAGHGDRSECGCRHRRAELRVLRAGAERGDCGGGGNRPTLRCSQEVSPKRSDRLT